MRPLLRSGFVISVVLVLLVLPFVLFGERLQEVLVAWFADPGSRLITAAAIVGVLATDIFLPIPSSVICTAAGGQLGTWGGTLAAWLGLSLGAVVGFALARRWGWSFAQRFSRPEDLAEVQKSSERYGPTLLLFTRGVPVLAEASVLLMGIHRLTWQRFLPPVLLANLGLALAYSVFGDVAERHGWLPFAIAVSVGLPVVLAFTLQRWLRDQDATHGSNEDT